MKKLRDVYENMKCISLHPLYPVLLTQAPGQESLHLQFVRLTCGVDRSCTQMDHPRARCLEQHQHVRPPERLAHQQWRQHTSLQSSPVAGGGRPLLGPTTGAPHPAAAGLAGVGGPLLGPNTGAPHPAAAALIQMAPGPSHHGSGDAKQSAEIGHHERLTLRLPDLPYDFASEPLGADAAPQLLWAAAGGSAGGHHPHLLQKPLPGDHGGVLVSDPSKQSALTFLQPAPGTLLDKRNASAESVSGGQVSMCIAFAMCFHLSCDPNLLSTCVPSRHLLLVRFGLEK